MSQPRIIGHRELRGEMMAVARGERPVPAHAGTQTFESVEALMRLLTPENRRLLALIRDRSPRSIAELAANANVDVINMSLGGLSAFNDGAGVQETLVNRRAGFSPA